MKFSAQLGIFVFCFISMMLSRCSESDAEWESESVVPHDRANRTSSTESTHEGPNTDDYAFDSSFEWLDDDEASATGHDYKRDVSSYPRQWPPGPFDGDDHGSRFIIPPQSEDRIELCERSHDVKIACFCLPDDQSRPVESVDCWIFSSNLQEDSPSWEKFKRGKHVNAVSLTVQQVGYMNFIPSAIAKAMPMINTFRIRNADIARLTPETLMKMEYLQFLHISKSNVEVVEENSITNYPRLREIVLNGNLIHHIEIGALRNLPALEQLILRDNRLTELQDGLLAGVDSLVYLDLSNNLIESITAGTFQGLANLQLLKLGGNRLTRIDDKTFVELWCLHELHLDNNGITRISNRAFDGLNKLNTISLRGNRLIGLGDGIFRGTAALLNVFLQNNSLESLSFETFLPVLDNLKRSPGKIHVAGNNFKCDCRMSWIFQPKEEYATLIYPELLMKVFDDFTCDLKKPEITYFKTPMSVETINKLADYQANRNNAMYNDDGALLGMNEALQNATEAGIEVPFFSLRPEGLVCDPEPVEAQSESPLLDANRSNSCLAGTVIFPLAIALFYMIGPIVYWRLENYF